MLGAIIGIVDGSQDSSFSQMLPVAAATGILVLGLVTLSMVTQMAFDMSLPLIGNITLHGTLFGNPFAGTGLVARMLTVGIAGVYAAADTIVGWAIWQVIEDIKESYMMS